MLIRLIALFVLRIMMRIEFPLLVLKPLVFLRLETAVAVVVLRRAACATALSDER